MAEPSEHDQSVSDADLLRRHLEGDPQAFAAIINRHRRELFNFLAKFLGDLALAEDVFQETFLQLYLSAATFDQERRLKPWLFTIATNKARDALRNRTRKQAAPLDAAIAGEDDQRGTFADLIPSDIPSPQENVQNQETREIVQTIVGRMPENLRAVLLLAYFHELPYRDVADILHLPLGTVKSRLHAAVRHFAEQWKTAVQR